MLIDNACKLWPDTTCEESSACELYNRATLTISFLAFCVAILALTAILFFAASTFARNIHSDEDLGIKDKSKTCDEIEQSTHM